MHQACEIQQYRQRSHVIKCVLDNVFVMSYVHITLDLDPFCCWVKFAWSTVIGPQWIISFSHQSTILRQPINRVVWPSTSTSEVALVTVNQLLFWIIDKSFWSQVIRTLNVSCSTECPAWTTRSLVLYCTDSSLLLPVPDVWYICSELIRIIVSIVLNVIELEARFNSDAQKIFHLFFWHVSELSFTVNGRALLVLVDFLDFLKVLYVQGEPVKFVELGLVFFIVLLGVCLKLFILVNDGALRNENEG